MDCFSLRKAGIGNVGVLVGKQDVEAVFHGDSKEEREDALYCHSDDT